MRILNITETIVDGPGLRSSIYFAGCSHRCKGCHNPESWGFDGGEYITPQQLFNKIKDFASTKNITLSGGDPIQQPKQELIELLKLLKEDNFNIWVYTGYAFEELDKEILSYIDVLVDGKFIEELKSDSCIYRGSTNQRLIDVKASKDKIVEWNSKN